MIILVGSCHELRGRRKLWLFGGKTRGGQYKTFYDDLWTYDYDTVRWSLRIDLTD